MNQDERLQLIDDLIEGKISEADFLRLEAELSIDAKARQEYYDRLALSLLLETEAGATDQAAQVVDPAKVRADDARIISFPNIFFSSLRWVAAGAAVILVIGLVLHFRPQPTPSAPLVAQEEQRASGYAVLAGQANAVWKNSPVLADGALLPSGPLNLESGLVHLELFSGVTLIVEGPAAFEVSSPMEMSVQLGKIRAHVPQPAQGFRIRTEEGDIVDLGTQLALDVAPSRAEVHVLDGEVEWHPTRQEMRPLQKGEALRWTSDGQGSALAADAAGFVGPTELRDQLTQARHNREEDWRQFRDQWRHDPRLVAFYEMKPATPWSRQLPNVASAGKGITGEGAVVAAKPVADRWGHPDGALDFSPTGSRVRLVVPGEYRSLTLLCWVRINSLDRWYNSLFLTDGHEQFEPHWQIMDDGRLFFSVKKNDVWDPKKGEKDKHIFYSPHFWEPSLSGQWLMIATTYDVEARQVTHYLNGDLLNREAIPPEYLVETVRIGNASLGNWGLPERDEPRFAVRNLNGSMSEFALFRAALNDAEIAELYRLGRP